MVDSRKFTGYYVSLLWRDTGLVETDVYDGVLKDEKYLILWNSDDPTETFIPYTSLGYFAIREMYEGDEVEDEAEADDAYEDDDEVEDVEEDEDDHS